VNTNDRRPGHQHSGFIVSHFVNYPNSLIHDLDYTGAHADDIAGEQFTLIFDVLLDRDHAGFLFAKK